MVDGEGEGNACYYAAEEKEYHLTDFGFMEWNCNFVFFHCFMSRGAVVGCWAEIRLLLVIGG